MNTPHVRLGFVGISGGTGGIHGGSWAGNSHVPYLKSERNTSYKITALQNSSKAASEKAAARFELGNIAGYDDPEDLANDSNVDLVAVSVKVPSHYDAVMPALHAGKDLFVEWPLARNLQDAEEMAALAKEKGVRTLVGLQARQDPSVIAVKKLIDEGKLGDILGTTMHGYGMIFGDQNAEDFRYLFPVENGANLLTIPFGHAVDALCWTLGEWDYVSATLANRRPKVTVVNNAGDVIGEDTKTSHDFVSVTGTLQKSGGVVTVIYEGGNNPSGGPGLVWQINGTQGTILLEGPIGHPQMAQPSIKCGRLGEELKVIDVKQVGQDFSYNVGEAWEAFAGKNNGSIVSFEDALVRHKMIDAIYRSDQSGKREEYM